MRPARSTIVVVLPERWLRTALRGALLARGHHVVDMSELGELVSFKPDRSRHGVVRAIVVDQNALSAAAAGAAERMRGRYAGVPRVLLQSWMTDGKLGDWTAVLPRSATAAEVVERLEELVPAGELRLTA